MDHEINELNRRVANLIRLGTVAEADYETARVRVQCGELVSGWLPWFSGRAGKDRTWWAPETGEQVMVLSPSGDMAQGVVLLGLFQEAHPAPGSAATQHTTVYDDGAVLQYDREAHHLKAVLPDSGTAELQAAGGVTITGDVAITGDIDVTGNVGVTGALSVSEDADVTGTVTAMRDVKAGIVSLKTHIHPAPGGSTGTPT